MVEHLEVEAAREIVHEDLEGRRAAVDDDGDGGGAGRPGGIEGGRRREKGVEREGGELREAAAGLGVGEGDEDGDEDEEQDDGHQDLGSHRHFADESG